MRIHIILLTIFLALQTTTMVAQAPNIQWQDSFGGSSYESASDVLQTNDGGYLIIGSTASTDGDIGANNGNKDVWVVKLNATGTLECENTYGGSG